MSLTPDALLSYMQRKSGRALTAREILSAFKLSRMERQQALRLLESLVEEGLLARGSGRRYVLPRAAALLEGRISVHRDGYGFVVSEKAKDVFIPARYLGGAMDGDRVAVRVDARGRLGRPEGRVVRVLEHAHATIAGRFEIEHGQGLVIPADPRLHRPVLVDADSSHEARPGQMVILQIDSYPDRSRGPQGRIVEVLGDADDPAVEIRVVARKFGLPEIFPDEILKAAAAIPGQVGPQDLVGREDLRQVPLVTIDGETAMDFDDAVAVRAEKGGLIRLWVAIADVGYYVAPDSLIDQEAFERATSVYFPGCCIPMLPEALSNDICSLKPWLERLAVTAELVFDREGNRLSSRFYRAVIRSRARLTYSEVRDMVEKGDADTIGRYADLFPQLQEMKELALRLMDMRRKRGSLDFDLPEAEVVLGLRGRPEDIVRAERNLAHRIIEEFMLAANEAVAAFLNDRGVPLPYRIHEPPEPEKLELFQEFVAHLNYGLSLGRDGVDSRQLQALLAEVSDKPEERLVNQVLLRSMKQARYAAENVGHFGLAADRYCHFTSPIRRYPDLVVHRILCEVLEKEKLSDRRLAFWRRLLPTIAERSSQNERRAMEAERDIIDLKKCQFMLDKVGREYRGFVSGVQPFGFFVELEDVFVEGLVHIATLKDDYYQYEEALHRLIGQHRRRVFQIGDEVMVRLSKVDVDRRELDFELVAGDW